MASNKTDPGYERAISAVKRLQGIERGAHSWLATKLKISRQGLFYWSKTGFPDEVIPKVARITQLPAAALVSAAPLTIKIPRAAWDGICTTSPKSLTEQATIL